MITNAAILAIILAASLTIGLKAYVLFQFPVIFPAGVARVWLFYVQHHFEGVYWARHYRWDRKRASLQGSSYCKLPKVIQWVTGNIGLHHIHHLQPRIPNYHLQRRFDETRALLPVEPLTLRRGTGCIRLKLWDEKNEKLVSFNAACA
jgi:omega-6 fatty acid desaturase (delta-12 desaturase)